MADWRRMAVAGLRREREKLVAQLQPELDRIDRALEALSGGTETAAPKRARRRKVKELTPEQKAKRGAAMQAAHDAMAVKRGTATAEQIARHNKRLAEKTQMDPHARTVARMSPGASKGANLAEAAG